MAARHVAPRIAHPIAAPGIAGVAGEHTPFGCTTVFTASSSFPDRAVRGCRIIGNGRAVSSKPQTGCAALDPRVVVHSRRRTTATTLSTAPDVGIAGVMTVAPLCAGCLFCRLTACDPDPQKVAVSCALIVGVGRLSSSFLSVEVATKSFTPPRMRRARYGGG